MGSRHNGVPSGVGRYLHGVMCYNLRKNLEETLDAMDEEDCRIYQHTHITRGGLAGDLPNVNDTLDMVMRRFGRGSSDLASRSNEEAESPS